MYRAPATTNERFSSDSDNRFWEMSQKHCAFLSAHLTGVYEQDVPCELCVLARSAECDSTSAIFSTRENYWSLYNLMVQGKAPKEADDACLFWLRRLLQIEQLEVVSTFKYLGLTFHAEHGLQPTFMALKQKMFASWALLKRQYGRLQCLSSVGLMFRLCTTVVQSTACYGCEVWGAATFAAKEREDLMKGYLQILREITGVRTSTPTAILLAELGLQALSDEWLLRAAKFWNNLAALPPDNIHRCMALDSCKSAIGPRNRRKNWAGSMYRAIIDTGYQLAIRLDDMDAIDITALRHFITQRRDAVWEGP